MIAIVRPPVRSALFVPANRRPWIEKAPVYGADTLVLDLEDATPVAEKAAAREVVAAALPGLRERGQGVWIRVNDLSTGLMADDLLACCRPGAEAIVVPKVQGPEAIREIDRLISYAEGANGVPFGTIGIVPLLETVGAIHGAYDIFRASSRVCYGGSLTSSKGDVERSVGFRWSGGSTETFVFRSTLLVTARAAGIENPMTGLVTELDADLVRGLCVESRGLGYDGIYVIHPTHVPIANEIFGPTAEDHRWATEVLAAYALAADDGRGTLLDTNGRLIDIAHVKTAQKLAAAYERLHGDRKPGLGA